MFQYMLNIRYPKYLFKKYPNGKFLYLSDYTYSPMRWSESRKDIIESCTILNFEDVIPWVLRTYSPSHMSKDILLENFIKEMITAKIKDLTKLKISV